MWTIREIAFQLARLAAFVCVGGVLVWAMMTFIATMALR